MHGTIKMWNAEKGFGFISPEGGPDIFFHVTVLVGDDWDPEPGMRVTFVEGVNAKDGRPRAEQVAPA